MFSNSLTEAIKTRNPPCSLIKHQNRSQETFSLSHSAVDPEGTRPHCWEDNTLTWSVASQLQHNTNVALGHWPLGHLLKTEGPLLSQPCLQVVMSYFPPVFLGMELSCAVLQDLTELLLCSAVLRGRGGWRLRSLKLPSLSSKRFQTIFGGFLLATSLLWQNWEGMIWLRALFKKLEN